MDTFLEEDFKYKTTFQSFANVIVADEVDSFFSKASLDSLGGLLPQGVNPQDNPDLFYFAANGAVAGMCNLNGDSIYNESALEVVPFSKNKYINLDHKKEHVVGTILYPSVSEFGSNKLITSDEAKNLPVFNLCLAGIVWKPIKKELVQALIEANDPSSPNFGRISLSWEIFFNDYDIAVGSKIVKEARILSSAFDIEKYTPMLKQNGGSGMCPEGHVYRVIKNTNGPENPNVIIAGYSFVTDPAAEVKGVLPIESTAGQKDFTAPSEEEIARDKQIKEKNASKLQETLQDIKNIYTFISQSKNNSVTPIITMDITLKSIDDLATSWESLTKLESTAAVDKVLMLFRDKLKEASEQYAAQTKADKEATEKAKAELEKAIADTKELNSKLDETNKQLKEIKDLEAARAAQEQFEGRMAGFDSEYDLTDEDRQALVGRITGLDEQGFASFQKEFSVFAKEKNKKWKEDMKKKQDDEKTQKDKDTEETEAKKKSEAEQKAKEELAAKALASATTDGKSVLFPSIQPNQDLIKSMTETFTKGVKIRGTNKK